MRRMNIAVLGGAGAMGSGLAWRLARAGHDVIIGSREPERGEAKASEIGARLGADAGTIRGASYEAAAGDADLAILTVPFASQADILGRVKDHLAGKVLIDCTVPLRPPKVGRVQLPPEGAAALIAQDILGPETPVVSAFQNVGAQLLQNDAPIACDVLVCADDKDARALGVEIASAAGLRGIEAGPLANAAAAEALTSILIQINRRYKADHAGIRITGLKD